MEKKESFNRTEDTAQENPSLADLQSKTDFRNELFDRLVVSEMELYVALLIDNPPNDPQNNLFCGNVGEINPVVMEGTVKDYYDVSFINYKDNEDEFSRCCVNKKNLLPLFCFNPMTYDTIITERGEQERNLPDRQFSISEIREQWEKLNFDIISNNTLKNHKRVDTRFEVGKLVTVQFDFQQQVRDSTENLIIQAGQVGIISKTENLNINYVEVTFFSMSFAELVYKRKKLVSLDIPTNSSWRKKICIDKNYLFPLYAEQLQ